MGKIRGKIRARLGVTTDYGSYMTRISGYCIWFLVITPIPAGEDKVSG